MSENIDRAVALEVMGWDLKSWDEDEVDFDVDSPPDGAMLNGKVYRGDFYDNGEESGWDLFRFAPSTDIADAWRVVERMFDMGFRFDLSESTYFGEDNNGPPQSAWLATFGELNGSLSGDSLRPRAPDAICKAALEAVRAQRGAQA